MNEQDLVNLYRKNQEVLNQFRQLEEKTRRQIEVLMEGINQIKRLAYEKKVDLT